MELKTSQAICGTGAKGNLWEALSFFLSQGAHRLELLLIFHSLLHSVSPCKVGSLYLGFT